MPHGHRTVGIAGGTGIRCRRPVVQAVQVLLGTALVVDAGDMAAPRPVTRRSGTRPGGLDASYVASAEARARGPGDRRWSARLVSR